MFPGNRTLTGFPKVFDKKPELNLVEPLYDAHVINSIEENVKRGRIAKRFVIDSRARDRSKYANPNRYRIELPLVAKDVISVELIQGCIPNNPNVITLNNNQLFFEETEGVCLIAEVQPGTYTIEELLEELYNAMNDVGTSNYSITLLPNQNIVRIESDLTGGSGVFRLLLHEPGNSDLPIKRSIGPVLGFGLNHQIDISGTVNCVRENILIGNETCFTKELKRGDKIAFSSNPEDIYQVLIIESNNVAYLDRDGKDVCQHDGIVSASYTADHSYDLTKEKYVILNILEMNKLESASKSISDAYAVIPLTHEKDTTVINNCNLPRQREITYFNPPLGELRWMTIEFITHDGTHYDFDGREHFLEFEIKALNQRPKYNLIGDI